MKEKGWIWSVARIAGLLLLTSILFLVLLRLFESLILSGKPIGSAGASAGGLTKPRSPNADPFSVTGWYAATFSIATLLALPLSAGLLSFYRRAAVRSMRRRSHESAWPQADAPDSPSPEAIEVLPISITDRLSNSALSVEGRRLLRELNFAPWMTAAVYSVAGLVFAVLTAVFILIAGHVPISTTRFFALGWLFAWPAAVAVYLIVGTTKRTRIAVISVYFIVFFIIAGIAVAVSPKLTMGQVLGLWLIENLFPTVLIAIFINRRVRAVGPLILLLMIFAVFGSLTVPSLLISHAPGLARVAAGLLGGTPTFTAAEVLGFAGFGAVGWFVLQYVRHLYEKKMFNDQAILLGAVWLQFAVFWFVDFVFFGYAWLLSAVPVFISYIVVLSAGFALQRFRSASSGHGRRLLVLRVFALGKRSEQLFEAVANHWRYVGSIAQIAGPDLLRATVQPHEFLDFMSGKLARRFIDGPKALDLRLSESDVTSDAEGRFRVNDFFCHDDTWKFVLDRLVRDADAVLMDLRGFSPQNAGCVFEIEELINVFPIGRAVFIVDDTTDKSFLSATVKQALGKTSSNSPNRGRLQLLLLRFGGVAAGELQNLFTAICGAAAPA
jgi:hypothetical protein